MREQIKELIDYYHYCWKYPVFVKAAKADAKRFKHKWWTKKDVIMLGRQLDEFMKFQAAMEEKLPIIELTDIDELLAKDKMQEFLPPLRDRE